MTHKASGIIALLFLVLSWQNVDPALLFSAPTMIFLFSVAVQHFDQPDFHQAQSSTNKHDMV